ncbi:hypothetical protein [Rhodococcus ruber]|nr:hypothetical protein [Rhodococcus ruber]
MSELDETTKAALRERARQLAELAPPLTSEQLVLLRSIFLNSTRPGAHR